LGTHQMPFTVGSEATSVRQSGEPVGRFADDVETVGFQEGARLDPEAGVVVDDEDAVHACHGHRSGYGVQQG